MLLFTFISFLSFFCSCFLSFCFPLWSWVGFLRAPTYCLVTNEQNGRCQRKCRIKITIYIFSINVCVGEWVPAQANFHSFWVLLRLVLTFFHFCRYLFCYSASNIILFAFPVNAAHLFIVWGKKSLSICSTDGHVYFVEKFVCAVQWSKQKQWPKRKKYVALNGVFYPCHHVVPSTNNFNEIIFFTIKRFFRVWEYFFLLRCELSQCYALCLFKYCFYPLFPPHTPRILRRLCLSSPPYFIIKSLTKKSERRKNRPTLQIEKKSEKIVMLLL